MLITSVQDYWRSQHIHGICIEFGRNIEGHKEESVTGWIRTTWEHAYCALRLRCVGYGEKLFREFAAFHSSGTELAGLLRRDMRRRSAWFQAPKEHVASIFKGQAVFLNYFTLQTQPVPWRTWHHSPNNMDSHPKRPDFRNIYVLFQTQTVFKFSISLGSSIIYS
jgi:hypothetical protein